MRIVAYDRAAAVEYARKWAFGRNPEYYDFSEIGGDCTNFASQCLYAGSGIMNYTPVYGWYYESAGNRTASWTGVEYFYNFMVSNKDLGPFMIQVDTPEELEPGDFVQFGRSTGDFYHTPVVTGIQNGELLLAAHSYDAYNRPISTYSFAVVRYLHVAGVRKP